MNISKKLVTAVRGGASEMGEAIIDSQAIRILGQELRDAKTALEEAKTNLTAIIAERMSVERKLTGIKDSIKEHEAYAIQALDKGDESLASDVASKISKLEQELTIQQGILDGYEARVSNLKKLIRQTDRNIQAMDREISVVKTTERVQQANDMASVKFSGSDSSLRSATDSLERIKVRQQKREDQAVAAMELETGQKGEDLNERLEKAGIVESESSGTSVLERLKKQRDNSQGTSESGAPE